MLFLFFFRFSIFPSQNLKCDFSQFQFPALKPFTVTISCRAIRTVVSVNTHQTPIMMSPVGFIQTQTPIKVAADTIIMTPQIVFLSYWPNVSLPVIFLVPYTSHYNAVIRAIASATKETTAIKYYCFHIVKR